MTILKAVTTKLRPGTPVQAPDWEGIYRAELPRVLNFFRYRVTDPAAAEDLAATTFEKAWTARERYADRGKFSAWLMTIARNVATDYFRSRRPNLPIEAAGQQAGDPSPLAAVEAGEELARLRELLGRLPDHHRELVALKYGAELTNREIARQTGMSESNVGSTLFRIVQQLRLTWEEQR